MAIEDGKDREGKVRFDLIPAEIELAIAEILTFGIEKGYKEESWKDVPEKDYIGAERRHENKRRRGEIFDDESGLLHRAHKLTNDMFLLYRDIKEFGLYQNGKSRKNPIKTSNKEEIKKPEIRGYMRYSPIDLEFGE